MADVSPRWVLGFDASCGTCGEISSIVTEAGGGKVEILPLTHPETRRWREVALGSRTRMVPTLLRVRGENVRAWTGPAMVAPLVRRLGVRSTFRLVRSLGALSRRVTGREGPAAPAAAGLRRAQVLRLMAGSAVAIGLVLTDRLPAFADQEADTARAWALKNKNRLPRAYAEVAKLPIAYRKALFLLLPPVARSQLWVAHVTTYRATHLGSTPDQIAVMDRAVRIFGDVTTFKARLRNRPTIQATLDSLAKDGLAAFGHDEAYVLLAVLGPDPAKPQTPRPCAVAPEADWCHRDYSCWPLHKYPITWGGGCGVGWVYPCTVECRT